MIVTGSRSILDLDGVGLSHFVQMTPSLMKKMVVTTQVSIPSIARCRTSQTVEIGENLKITLNLNKYSRNVKNAQRDII